MMSERSLSFLIAAPFVAITIAIISLMVDIHFSGVKNRKNAETHAAWCRERGYTPRMWSGTRVCVDEGGRLFLPPFPEEG